MRSSDGRHVAAYTVSVSAGTRSVIVRTTLDPGDWSGVAIPVTDQGDHSGPSLSLLPDGAFLLVWVRQSGKGVDLVAKRSTDGVNWGDDIMLVQGNGTLVNSAFALVGDSPGVVDLYWTRNAIVNGVVQPGVVEHEHVVVLDAIFADGFD